VTNILTSGMQKLNITGSLLAKNSILNLVGRAIPLVVGIVAVPYIIKGIGTERFGLLSLIWIVLGYFTIFDLGLGRATTKYVAEALGRDDPDQVSELAWTAISVQTILGILGAFLVIVGSPLLVEHILKISPKLLAEARTAFVIAGLSVPIVLISSSFSGVLEAAQRFDLINIIHIPTSALTFILPVIGITLGFTLPGIIVLILIARFGALLSFMLMSFHIAPQMKQYSAKLKYFSHLLSFGSWITLSNVIGPILQYLDRFIIGAVLTVGVVAYYTAPFDVISRLWIIPGSIVMTIFPAFSTLGATKKEDLRNIFIRAAKYMFLIISLIVLLFIVFANDILRIWLNVDFANNSTLVLQILSIGVIISSLTHLALALFQGIGRPKIAVKIQFLLLPLSIILSFVLIKYIGIVGAAVSWTFCRAVGLILSWKYVWKIVGLNRAFLFSMKILHECVWFTIFACCLLPLMMLNNLLTKTGGVLFIYILFIFIGWKYLLDQQDRTLALTYLTKIRNRFLFPNSHHIRNCF
jgi:O-antigen/teichoic acid export membrane protein